MGFYSGIAVKVNPSASADYVTVAQCGPGAGVLAVQLVGHSAFISLRWFAKPQKLILLRAIPFGFPMDVLDFRTLRNFGSCLYDKLLSTRVQVWLFIAIVVGVLFVEMVFTWI